MLLTRVLAADGMITENERTLLEEAMSRAGLSANERTTVTELEVAGWTEASSAVRKLSEDERRALMGELVEAASVDGRLSPLEAAALKQITADLDLK
ncbi:MAG TPA: TerB family tellurite resistance protein [Polyangiaceae bacterium]